MSTRCPRKIRLLSNWFLLLTFLVWEIFAVVAAVASAGIDSVWKSWLFLPSRSFVKLSSIMLQDVPVIEFCTWTRTKICVLPHQAAVVKGAVGFICTFQGDLWLLRGLPLSCSSDLLRWLGFCQLSFLIVPFIWPDRSLASWLSCLLSQITYIILIQE